MKIRLIALALAVVMIFSLFAFTVSAAADDQPAEGTSDGTSVTRAEEVKWYFRIYNGHGQKRLWSVTYGYWLTDWIDIE